MVAQEKIAEAARSSRTRPVRARSFCSVRMAGGSARGQRCRSADCGSRCEGPRCRNGASEPRPEPAPHRRRPARGKPGDVRVLGDHAGQRVILTPFAKARCCMRQHEQALLFVRKAAEDEALLAEVISSKQVSTEIFGFHAQQSSEKLLKALLSEFSVHFPARTISAVDGPLDGCRTPLPSRPADSLRHTVPV